MKKNPNSSISLCFQIFLVIFLTSVCSGNLNAQELIKEVFPSNTALIGDTFTYRLTYTCNSSTGPCIGAQVIDLLPAEVSFISTFPASPVGDITAIQVTPNYMGTGRTRVIFTLLSPLSGGNSGVVLINVRFPNGITPDGTIASNTAEAVNLGVVPGSYTTPPAIVTGLYADPANDPELNITLLSSPANLDMPETYRIRLSNPNLPGTGNIVAAGPVVVILPSGTVFNGSTPAADCQPGCVGTTPATVTFSSPFSVPVAPGNDREILLNVTFPSATFPSGINVTTTSVADITVLGDAPQTIGPANLTHPVTTFVPAPGADFSVNMATGTPNPPALNQSFSYDINVVNNGNVPLNNGVAIFSIPTAMNVTSVRTGSYSNISDFAVAEGVRVTYEKNTALGVFTLWGSSPNSTTNTTLTAPPPGLGAGEYITRIRWEYGQIPPNMAVTNRPLVTGIIFNPNNEGGTVSTGDQIQACASFSAVYLAGPTNVNRSDCQSFILSGPFIQLNPAVDILSGSDQYFEGNNVLYRLQVRSAPQSSTPVPLEDIQVMFALAPGQTYNNFTFDDQGTGLPAPQQFVQNQNLLIFSWNAGSGSLGINQNVRINIHSVVSPDAISGNAISTLYLQAQTPGIGQRCSGSGIIDTEDIDSDLNTTENFCTASGTIFVVAKPVALCKSIQVQLTMDNTATVFASEIDNGSNGGFGDLQLLINGEAFLEFDCDDLGEQSITLLVTDFYGGTGVCTVNITILDEEHPCCEAPLAICQPFTTYLDETGTAEMTAENIDAGSIFECGLQSMIISRENFSCSDRGPNLVNLNITDIRGRQSSCSVIVTVADTLSPVIECNNLTLSFNGEQNIALTVNDLVIISNDNCNVAAITLFPDFVNSGQVGQSIVVTATAIDSSGNAGTCMSMVTIDGLPDGWSQDANGINCINGSEVFYNPDSQVFTLNSSNCYYASPFNADALAYAQYTLCGNGSITAEVTNITGSNGWAGVTMRENNQAGAKKVQLSTNLVSNFHRREIRTVANASSVPQQSSAQGRYWLRIVRTGNQFVGYSSSNGGQWVLSFAANISMSACIDIGLILSNYSINSNTSASFSNVSITGSGLLNAQVPNIITIHLKEMSDFDIYPNPVSNELNLRLNEFIGKSIEIQVTNLHNQIVYSKQISHVSDTTEQLHIPDLVPGMYVVRIMGSDFQSTPKLVLKH